MVYRPIVDNKRFRAYIKTNRKGRKRRKVGSYNSHRRLENRWYMKCPDGTDEELLEAFNKVSDYTYKILSYANSKELSKEEIDEARRIFAFARQGPRGAYFALNKNAKLTSADVIFILLSPLPSERIGELYEIGGSVIRKIRRGELPNWDWEYKFVKKIKSLVLNDIRYDKRVSYNRHTFSLSKLLSPGHKEIILYASSELKAKKLRKDLIDEKEYKRLEDNNTLDIFYPIEKIDIV